MRKRFLIPIFTALIFFPFVILILSYTRFFNDEVGDLLTTIVDNQTNARLYLGKIHGSILGSFQIDGAALMYDDKPIALIDTIKISHLPLSIIAKTFDVLQCDLFNPRFYLTRYKDGTFNVDHISKASTKPGGKFDWLIVLRNLDIHGGEFTYFDSTKISSVRPTESTHRFVPYDFELKNIDVIGSGNISNGNLTASIKDVSFYVEPAGLKIGSLKFDFFASSVGTEVSSLKLKSDAANVEGDFTLTGQNILDAIDITTFRQKHLTASLEAKGIDIKQVEKFFDLPIYPVSKVGVNCYASGDLDTLYIKHLDIRTDSSFVPLSATFYNLTDSSIAMRVESHGASVNSAELSALLNPAGIPGISRLKPLLINAVAEGMPNNLRVNVQLRSGETEFIGGADSHGGLYNGEFKFSNVHLGEILNSNGLNSTFNGEASFTLKNSRGSFPEGGIVVQIDSSTIDQASIRHGTVNIASVSDSLHFGLKFLTSEGNIDGRASVAIRSKAYQSDILFSGLDISSFIHVPSLNGVSTGHLTLSGSGFNVDSLDSRLSIVLDRSTLGGEPIDSSTFTLIADTREADKNLSLKSPFADVSVNGSFMLDKLPSQMSKLFSMLADSFDCKVTGKESASQKDSIDIAGLSASIDIRVKNARFIGKLLGISKIFGNPEGQINISSSEKGISFNASVDADTFGYSKDSLQIRTSRLNAEFNLNGDNNLSVWNSGSWSLNTNFRALDINRTHISAKILKVGYISSPDPEKDSLSILAFGEVDSLGEFYVDASGNMRGDSIDLAANTLMGKLYGASLTSRAPVHITYFPELFVISPATFLAEVDGNSSEPDSRISVEGKYSLLNGPDLRFDFDNIALAALQKIGHLDTNSLKLKGEVNGDANLSGSPSGTTVSIGFNGENIDYNGSKSKLVNGTLKIFGDYLEMSAKLSKPDDSSWYALRVDGTVPFSDSSSRGMQLKVDADSLNVSFLGPLLSGVDDLEGMASGEMTVSGKYSLPEFKGALKISDGKVRLAVNQITNHFDGTIDGQGNKLVLNPVVIENSTRQSSTKMIAGGSLEIRNNTIAEFDIDLNGSLLVLNSTSRKSDQGIYGTAIAGSEEQGLKLKGSLSRPFLEGSGIVQNTSLTLLPLQNKQSTQVENVIYRFPSDSENTLMISQKPESYEKEVASGSFIDSLRYDLNVETKDNVNFRMIFNPATNEELDAILGGKLHLSNLSGGMDLTGDVNILPGSSYNFYNKQFSASGKLRFTGDPLNPILDVTGIYQGIDTSETGTGKPQNVVVQLKITGTFNQPNVNISMTVDNVPYPYDQQTNAVSFILTDHFENELTDPQKQGEANILWSQYGAGAIGSFGSSYLSGLLTNFLGKQFDFIQSVALQYNPNSSFTDPNVQITSKIGPATLKVQTPVITTDIASTGFSFNYPLTLLFSNMIYLEASRNVAVNNRVLGQRETTDMLRLFYQISF
ncbi:MAG TPA: hypothetical protein VLX91_01005 [Candidatus Acidoferrales bacterium]|nr:hypothetical protein [Candidatus Acidoferrales bacterium]